MRTLKVCGNDGKVVRADVATAVLDRHVAALGIAAFAQALVKAAEAGRLPVMRFDAEESDHRHRLLRARRERQCHGRTTEHADDVAPVHWASIAECVRRRIAHRPSGLFTSSNSKLVCKSST